LLTKSAAGQDGVVNDSDFVFEMIHCLGKSFVGFGAAEHHVFLVTARVYRHNFILARNKLGHCQAKIYTHVFALCYLLERLGWVLE
jgi:hypothetical protein